MIKFFKIVGWCIKSNWHLFINIVLHNITNFNDDSNQFYSDLGAYCRNNYIT